MPSDEVATDFIKDLFDLSEADAAASVKVIKQNLHDYDLVETVGDREVINPPEEVLESLRPATTSDVSPNGQAGPEPEERHSSDVSASTKRPTFEAIGDIVPQIAFNIQIQLPSDASPETYEAIFRNIATHLLRRTPE